MILHVALLALALNHPAALVSQVADSANSYQVDPVLAVAIVEHESQFNPRALHRNSDSVDRGLWQMNSRWHPGENDGAAFLALCLFRARGDPARAAAYYHRWRLDAKGARYARAVMAIYHKLAGGGPMSILAKTRYPRLLALDVAREIIDALEPACSRICYAGSLRREKADVGDIEIMYIPREEPRFNGGLFAESTNMASNEISRLIVQGVLECRLNAKGRTAFGEKNKLMRHVASGIPVDLFAATFDNWFNYLVCRTGPAELNQRICVEAQRIGWRWAPYDSGFRAKDNGQVARMESEEDVFSFVGIGYAEPRDRA